MNRSGAAAIAAALALSSTQAFAQDVAADPAVTAEETPLTSGTTVEQPAPADELAPLAEPEPASDATASEASEPAPAPAARTTRTSAKASAPKPARSEASPSSQPPVEEAPVAEPAPVAAEAMTAPVTAVAPTEPAEAQAAPLGPVDEEIGYGLGAAALLALGVGAFAVSRRRRRRIEEGDDEPLHHFEEEAAAPVPAKPEPARYDPPIFAPAMAGHAGSRPAFAWGHAAAAAAPARAGETHVERAMRGPTPDNPSLSIRKRLKRAAFFDKREREIAQGKGQPVDRFAGLPEAVAPTAPAPAAWATRAPQRELEPA